MKHTLIILALLCASCLATSGEIDRAIAEITGDIAAVARSGEESAEAAREAYRQGQITYTELQARLRDVTVASLDAAKETAETVLEGVKETIEQRPEVIAETAGNAAGALIPGPLGQLAEMLILAGGAYAAASRKAKKDAEDAAWDVRHERVVEHLAKAEAGGKK